MGAHQRHSCWLFCCCAASIPVLFRAADTTFAVLAGWENALMDGKEMQHEMARQPGITASC